MDAFGTGYSSLSYLRDLPVDELKIDRSFILNMADDARAAALVACSLALARGLSVRMVTEGVQNHITNIELSSLGYDRAQGYYCPGLFPLPSLNHGLSIKPATDKLGDVSRWVRSRALDEVPLGFLPPCSASKERLDSHRSFAKKRGQRPCAQRWRGFIIQRTSATNEHYGEFSLSRRGNASRSRGGFIHSSTPQHILWMESR